MAIGGIGGGGGLVDNNLPVSGGGPAEEQKMTNKSPICQASVTQTIDQSVRPRAFAVIAESTMVPVEKAISGLVKSTQAAVRSGLSVQDLLHIVSKIGSQIEIAVKEDLSKMSSVETDIMDRIDSMLESLIKDHSEVNQSLSGKGFSIVDHRRIKQEVMHKHGPTITSLVMPAMASESIKVEGDISHLEALNIHKLYEFSGALFGKVQKLEIAEESYKSLGVAMGQKESTTDPVKIAALLESKGCGKTLKAETKSRIVENVCKELVLLASESPKVEKEKGSEGYVRTGESSRLAKEPVPVKAVSLHVEVAVKKDDAHREEARATERSIAENIASKQLDRHMKQENEKKLDAELEEQNKRINH